jgi:hypothetical protein
MNMYNGRNLWWGLKCEEMHVGGLYTLFGLRQDLVPWEHVVDLGPTMFPACHVH